MNFGHLAKSILNGSDWTAVEKACKATKDPVVIASVENVKSGLKKLTEFFQQFRAEIDQKFEVLTMNLNKAVESIKIERRKRIALEMEMLGPIIYMNGVGISQKAIEDKRTERETYKK